MRAVEEVVEDGGDGENDDGHDDKGKVVFDEGDVAKEISGESE